MNTSIINSNQPLTMSSREIAKTVGATHDSVLKTIRSLVERGVVSGNEAQYQHEQNKQWYPEFNLDYRNTMVVVSGYSPELRAAVVDRWLELEERANPKALTQDEQLLQLAQGVIRLTQERDEAIRTKAQINDKRTATLMNKASQDAKRIKKLEDQLQDQGEYLAIIPAGLPQYVDTETKTHAQSWRVLKEMSIAMEKDIKKVDDPRYGKVNTYHVDVIAAFRKLYC